MMELKLGAINWLAVLVAGIVTFLLGGVWYQAMFGKLWVKHQGYSPEQVKEMQAKMKPALFFGGMIVCYLVLAFAVAALVTAFNLKDAGSGLLLGFLLWLGPTASLVMTSHIATQKPIALYLIDVGFELIAILFTTTLLCVWR